MDVEFQSNFESHFDPSTDLFVREIVQEGHCAHEEKHLDNARTADNEVGDEDVEVYFDIAADEDVEFFVDIAADVIVGEEGAVPTEEEENDEEEDEKSLKDFKFSLRLPPCCICRRNENQFAYR